MAVVAMIVSLLGGLALFLFGIDQLTEALKAIAGDQLRAIIGRLTTNRFTGALSGAFVTAIVQSSSVTTVLVVGFTTAGLMTFSQSIGVIMGANIGTTITAQIVAFKVTKAALLLIAVGFGFLFFATHETVKRYGGAVMGLGLVFFGMTIMSDAMAPLRSYEPFLALMIRMENPFIGIVVGALFTGLIQSSSATTAIVIVLASQGFITLSAGIALAFGANVGTCVTALLAAIGKPPEAVRAAITHVLFNLGGVLLWLAFIDQLADLVVLLSPGHESLAGAERLAAETPRQIANAHTIFNVANTLLFIGFTTPLARLVVWLVPDQPPDPADTIAPIYLDESLLQAPALALLQARREIERTGEQVMEHMLRPIMPAILRGDEAELRAIKHADRRIDRLQGAILTYLGKVSEEALTEKQSAELLRLMDATNDLENIGDVIETNLVQLGRRRIKGRITISRATEDVLTAFYDVVVRAFEAAIVAVGQNDLEAAKTVTRQKKVIRGLVDTAALHESQRLVAKEPGRIEAYTIEMDITEKLQRIYFFSRRMARTVIADAKAS